MSKNSCEAAEKHRRCVLRMAWAELLLIFNNSSAITGIAWLLFTPFQQRVKIHAESPSVMDFYLLAIRFLTDLAVNAKSCLNR